MDTNFLLQSKKLNTNCELLDYNIKMITDQINETVIGTREMDNLTKLRDYLFQQYQLEKEITLLYP